MWIQLYIYHFLLVCVIIGNSAILVLTVYSFTTQSGLLASLNKCQEVVKSYK
jgi:hypothetical protein